MTLTIGPRGASGLHKQLDRDPPGRSWVGALVAIAPRWPGSGTFARPPARPVRVRACVLTGRRRSPQARPLCGVGPAAQRGDGSTQQHRDAGGGACSRRVHSAAACPCAGGRGLLLRPAPPPLRVPIRDHHLMAIRFADPPALTPRAPHWFVLRRNTRLAAVAVVRNAFGLDASGTQPSGTRIRPLSEDALMVPASQRQGAGTLAYVGRGVGHGSR